MNIRIVWLSSCVIVIVLLLGLWLPERYVVPVLMYHSIGYSKPEYCRINNVSPEAFERHIKFIRNNGYTVLSVDDYVKIIKNGTKFPSKSVVITFDDGVLNNFTHAYPILKKYSVPAIVFIPSGLVGSNIPEDGVFQMGSDQLREMLENGITIGSHTVRHSYLPDLSVADARKEIVNSKLDLEKIIGRPVNYFAYPSGGFSSEIKTMVKDAGYEVAFTTNRGMDRWNHDLFELKRIRPKNSDGSLVLWVKLSGYYNLFRDLQKGY